MFYFDCPKLSFLISFFYRLSFLIIMSIPLMVHSTRKGFEVSQRFDPIAIRPHESVLWLVKVRSEKRAKKSVRVIELKNHNLLLPFKQI